MAIGGIVHETHSFAVPVTDLEDFRRQTLHFGDEIPVALKGTRSAAAGMIDNARSDWQLLPTVYARRDAGRHRHRQRIFDDPR